MLYQGFPYVPTLRISYDIIERKEKIFNIVIKFFSMSYKLFSKNNGSEHDLKQWNERNLEGELKGFTNRTLTQKFQEYLSGKNYRIMEGGCGFGAWCKWLEEIENEVIGIEYDERIIQKAKEFDKSIPIELGNILDLNYPSASFDAYISLGVIEHFENGPQKALVEAKRILKPGGVAFITTPYLNPLRKYFSHPLRSLFFWAYRITGKKIYFWEYRFTNQELENYIKQAGFEIIETCIDDYDSSESNRHIGLWADWFFLRKKNGEIWELNTMGKLILRFLKLTSPKNYCSGWLVIARTLK